MEDHWPLPKVAERFNVSARTIRNWIEEQGFPKPFYIGRKPFFRMVEVMLWAEKQRENKVPPPEPPKAKAK